MKNRFPTTFAFLLALALTALALPAHADPAASLTFSVNPVDEGQSFTLNGAAGVGLPANFQEQITTVTYERVSPDPVVIYTGPLQLSTGPIAAPAVGPGGALHVYQFTVTTSDFFGVQRSSVSQASIPINNVNQAPAATPDAKVLSEDASVLITLAGTDPDGDALTPAVVDLPLHGALTGTPPALTYTPHANFFGADSFTFTVNDGTVDSAPAAVTLTVTPVNNDPPVAVSTSVTTLEDAPKPIVLSATDPDGDALDYQIVAFPSQGQISGVLPNVTYTPNAHYHGPDSFAFKARAGGVDTSVATISITVSSVNDPPVGVPQTVSTQENTPVDVTLTSTDVDGSTATYSVTSGPDHGVLSGTPPAVTYTPNSGFTGVDSFRFVANDGLNASSPAKISINIDADNIAPVAVATGPATAFENTKVVLSAAQSTDGNGDALTYDWIQIPSPTVSLHKSNTATPDFTAPMVNSTTTLTFQLTVTDPQLSSATAIVTVAILNDAANNSAPSVTVTPVSPVISGDVVALTATASDADGDAINQLWELIPSSPTPSITGASTLSASFTAPEVLVETNFTFQLSVWDVHHATTQKTVVVKVKPNRAPEVRVRAESPVVNELTEARLFGWESFDPDGDGITFKWKQTAGDPMTIFGSTTSTATFTSGNIHGELHLTFELTVTDARGSSTTAAIPITIQNVNANNHTPTVSIAAPASVFAGTTVELKATALDEDAIDVLTFHWEQVDGPHLTNLTVNGNVAQFTSPGVSGIIAFTFKVTVGDGQGGIVSSTHTVTVQDAAAAAGSGIPLLADPKIFPSPFSPHEGGATIRYTLRNPADVMIIVSDIFGRQVREIRAGAGAQGGTAGDNDVHWDGRNGAGDNVANGAYIVQIRANDGSGSAKKTERVGVLK